MRAHVHVDNTTQLSMQPPGSFKVFICDMIFQYIYWGDVSCFCRYSTIPVAKQIYLFSLFDSRSTSAYFTS